MKANYYATPKNVWTHSEILESDHGRLFNNGINSNGDMQINI